MTLSTSPDRLAERSFLLYGMGVTNRAVARALRDHGRTIVVADDGDATQLAEQASEFGAEMLHAPDAEALIAAVTGADAVVPAPGLPEHHRLFAIAAAAGRPVLSEFDLADAWDDRPVLAITGTNGKTTVTTLVQSMMELSGVPSAAVGNLETPLVAAIADPDVQCFVVEASSFRLAHTRRFRPRVATWLNFAEDHLDVHESLEVYRAAKARIWADQGPSDVAVANVEDPYVSASIPDRSSGPAVVRYGLHPEVGGEPTDYHEEGTSLIAPGGTTLVDSSELWGTLPHDRSNALAAAATALSGGATLEGVRQALRSFTGLAHRVEFIAERDGIRWFDDSKATAPHATLAAVRGFESVVLIAGGRNKGLDLAALGDAADHVRAVIGIGEAGPEVIAALPGRPGGLADSMAEAVRVAASVARSGDVVLLSPGCASFDWYGSYSERGEDFAAEVRSIMSGARR